MRTARRLAVGCLLLFFMCGSLMAQNDRQYVIERDGHYLSHAGGTLRDATSFSPDCIWYSSNNYNYYFMDGTAKKYLSAPLALNGALSVSDDPGTQNLSNSTLNYFFWDWDHGLARGVLHLEGGGCPSEYNSSGSQCWQAVWVSYYEEGGWMMSSVYGYQPTPNSARFLRVTVTDHGEELSNETGGVGNLADFAMNYQDTHPLDGTASAYTCTYTPAYTQYDIAGLNDPDHNTNIEAKTYYYYGGQYQTTLPASTNFNDATPSGYVWSLSGDGAAYLRFEDNQYTIANPTLEYYNQNETSSHQYATLTLTVTYSQDGSQVTQTRTATVTVKIQCQNPTLLDDNTVVTYVGATILWLPTAEEYEVSWKKSTESDWTSVTVGNVTSYTITGLDFGATYNYKVRATCVTTDPTSYSFNTLEEPGLMVIGNIFGGGRMANVGGDTEIVIVNCDSIGGIYGGNDIAGAVLGSNGSKITLGVNDGNLNGYDTEYGTTPEGVSLKFGDVYGGGNGYYAYNGSSFEAASSDYISYDVAPGESVKAMTRTHQVGDIVWTNTGTDTKTLNFPSVVKTEILVSDNYVTADSIFGGAKNAFLTYNGTQEYPDGSLITIDGGTIMAVFGGNNFGGAQGYGQHHIVVTKTTTNLVDSIYNFATTGYGRSFGIRYLFGGGNKVYGSTTNVEIFGGQCDTIFAGGNSADVYAANVTVNCAMGSGSGNIWDKVYSNAINTYDGGIITPKDDYGWNGFGGIYNVRTLFGGNNMATFDSHLNVKVPEITLTSGSLGTVYGGGNSGDMWGYSETGTTINGETVNYGTHVKMDSPTVLVDYLYGGCQMSNVRYSTWVELNDGHVGTVYGGCNVSGDVGSTRVNMNAPQFLGEDIPNPEYQKVYGGTYVVASGGIVYKNLFAGGNGYYHCLDGNGYYQTGLNYTSHNYVGLASPTHNETHVVVNPGAIVKGNVYAGGNLACVGFDNNSAQINDDIFPRNVGLSSVRMSGGHVYGNVYGGGNMANVYGSNEVQVSGGTIDESLYGGNDRLGTVATPISNRVLPLDYQIASDGVTSLIDPKVYTYVGLTGNPSITNVYGGGNGDYAYFTTFEEAEAYTGDKETVVSCNIGFQPIQQCTFVDVGVQGGADGAHIGTVYGGGDGVTVTGFIKVFFNVQSSSSPIGYSNVGTIFGGNNKGDLLLVPEVILLNGQVNTVYGGCNKGAMTAGSDENAPTKTIVGAHGDTYSDIGSYVHLLASYDGDGEGGHEAVTPNIKVMDAIYGGCRMNGVTKNSLVLVDGSDFTDMTKGIFGGSDISGTVSDTSRVAVTGGFVGNVFGGGNGDYDYETGIYEGLTPPSSNVSRVDMLAGTANNLYAGGNACGSGSTISNISGGTVTTGIYGGSNAKGTISGDVLVNVTGGVIGASGAGNEANIHGGGYGAATQTEGNVTVNIGATSGGENPTYSGTAVIYGDVYGGSALGQVSASNKLTQVNFYKGTINGDVYGGALGNNNYAAEVSGSVEVNIHGGVFNAADGTLGGGRIFGCNNANGTPKGNVNVNIYATDHGADFEHNLYPTTPDGGWTVDELATNALTQAYAISAVYGGGNKAAYKPVTNKSATVHIYYCNNTIDDVYGGGNAADVGATGEDAVSANTFVIVDGGRINRVFGGGNGAGANNPGANIYGTATTTVKAGLINQVFGGGNEKGSITATSLTVNHASSGCEEVISEIFGGGNLAPITTSEGISTLVECGTDLVGDIYGGSNKAKITGNVTLNIKGGAFENVFGGSKGVAGTPADIDGKVTLNLMGGKITNAFGGSNINGNITRDILVNVVDLGETCGLDLTNVYGGGNVTPYAPNNGNRPVVNVIHIAQTDGIKGNVFGGAKGSTATVTANPIVNIGYDATSMSNYVTGLTIPASPRAYVKGNVFGGGDAAPVNGSTTVNVFKGEIVHKLVGGGNEIAGDAGVSGNVVMNINGGMICTEPTGIDAGVYGGCNTSGIVGGNITINIDGSSTTPTTIGTQAALQAVAVAGGNPVSVHGGGYGHGTSTNGNITVNFGTDVIGESSTHNPYLTLYGDLYGGSALGTVNNDANDVTTVTILNGSVKSYMLGNTQYGGNIYGGGLGDVTHAATVNGEVHVNIGDTITSVSERIGKASLINCNVFGCNNKSGSPQRDVYVHVFQTNHTTSDVVTNLDGDYAIKAVYGGGNRADYEPTANYSGSYALKAHNYVHACDNTIGTVYGGGRAASADGVVTKVDGGRFEYIFGGGNGQIEPADIGWGGIDLTVCSGHVGYKYVGCDMGGNVLGALNDHECTDNPCDEPLIVDYFFFGANKATIIGGLIDTIPCDPVNPMVYKNVYAGSRLATIYGDIYMVVRGGIITNLFGGSQGSLDRPGHIRKFPHLNNPEEMALVPDDAHNDMITYLTLNPDLQGTGGNIYMKLEGGSITNVYGGNQLYGNIDGDIIIMVDTIPSNCPLSIDTLYGGNEKAIYNPDLVNGQPRISPQVYIKDGKVNYDVYGGSLGDRRSEIANAGRVTSHPYVIVGSDQSTDTAVVGRNLYGGGSMADVEGSTKVVLRGKATIDVVHVDNKEYGGNVYGGSRLGYVAGNTDVQIAPTAAVTPIVIPTPPPPQFYRLYYSYNITEGGSIEVTDGYGHVLVSGSQVAQGTVLHIRAIPNTNAGYSFYSWGVSGGAAVVQPYQANTALIMGSSDATLGVNFVSSTMPHHTLTLTADPVAGGTFKVNNEIYTNPVSIPNGFSVTVQAMPADGYAFAGWTVVSGSVTITSGTNSTSSITFTMSGDVSLKANFVPAHILTLTATPEGACRFEVNEEFYDDPVSIPQGASVTIKANPVEGHTFTGWTIPDSVTLTSGDATLLTITITMGTSDATLTATFDE